MSLWCLLAAASVNNSADEKSLGVKIFEIFPTNISAGRLTSANSPSRQTVRWSLTNTQLHTVSISWSHYKPFVRISQQQAKPSSIKRFFSLIDNGIESLNHLHVHQADATATFHNSRFHCKCFARGSHLDCFLNYLWAANVMAIYDKRIDNIFNNHPEAYLFEKLPGAGFALAPRLLAFFGTDRSRYAAAANVQTLSGIAPVTKSSGKTRVVYFRWLVPTLPA